MYPELLKIGPVTIYSYGLMLGIAFFVGNILITRELKRRRLDTSLATTVTMIALGAGVAGAKLFHIIENWSDFLRQPVSTLFSSGGLTWYGGFLLATLLVYLFLRAKKMRLLTFADIASPALAIGYGFGRVGCQLAGDGDYGGPTNLPWAMTYPHGTVPTLSALNRELAEAWVRQFPGKPVPEDIPVHPAPVYEILLAIAVFTFLYRRRKKDMPIGNQFGWFLALHSLCRFLVEFIRLNPLIVLNLSQAQLISIALFAWGVYLVVRSSGSEARLQVKPGRDR
jgi:phosphatidylglycerol---prolipoprotein diacylglyceryl transferase